MAFEAAQSIEKNCHFYHSMSYIKINAFNCLKTALIVCPVLSLILSLYHSTDILSIKVYKTLYKQIYLIDY